MKPTMAARGRALQDMTVPELRVQYHAVPGKEGRFRRDSAFPWRGIP